MTSTKQFWRQHNVVIQQLSDAISALQRTIFDRTFLTETRHLKLTVQEHGALFDAIRRKEPRLAERASQIMVERTAIRAKEENVDPASARITALNGSKQQKTRSLSGDLVVSPG